MTVLRYKIDEDLRKYLLYVRVLRGLMDNYVTSKLFKILYYYNLLGSITAVMDVRNSLILHGDSTYLPITKTMSYFAHIMCRKNNVENNSGWVKIISTITL